MKNYLKMAPRIFILLVIFTSIQSITQKHIDPNIGASTKSVIAMVAILLETALCRYFKSDYGRTDWTFYRKHRPSARPSTTEANAPKDQTFLEKTKTSKPLKNFISFFIYLFFTVLTIIGASESIGKIFPHPISGNIAGLLSTVIAIPLASLFVRYYQSIETPS